MIEKKETHLVQFGQHESHDEFADVLGKYLSKGIKDTK